MAYLLVDEHKSSEMLLCVSRCCCCYREQTRTIRALYTSKKHPKVHNVKMYVRFKGVWRTDGLTDAGSSYLLIKPINHGLDPLHGLVCRHGRAGGRRGRSAQRTQVCNGTRERYVCMKRCPRSTRRTRACELFSPFRGIHHATAMTHHRKSSSATFMGGVGAPASTTYYFIHETLLIRIHTVQYMSAIACKSLK